MANFSSSRWETFNFAVSESMQKPEFKYKPSAVLKKYKENTPWLIPASEIERVLRTKQDDQHTMDIHIINKQDITTGSARAYNHSGSNNDSTNGSLSFTTYSAAFKYSVKQADRVIWNEAEMVAKQILSAAIALHSDIESDALAQLDTDKSQEVVSTSPQGGTWDESNYIFQVASADNDRFMQRVKGFMRQQYYRGMIDLVVDEYLLQEAEYLLAQGAGNSANTQFQAMGLDPVGTTESIVSGDYMGMGYAFEKGTIGMVDWIPNLNRQGFGDTFKNGGLYTTIPDPLGSGLTFAVHEYATGADNNSTYGATQDVDIEVEISVDIAFEEAPQSTANASPIFKFGVQS